ncbi:MAG: hypothetical protein ABT940_08240 [Alphaproteobacteria bacterium]
MKWRMAIALAATLVVGCESTGAGYRQPVGAVLGGVGGGWLGSRIGSGAGRLAAISGGAFLGSLLGSNIGASLDRADRVSSALSSSSSGHREVTVVRVIEPTRLLGPIRNTPGYDIGDRTAPYWWRTQISNEFSPLPPYFAPEDAVRAVPPLSVSRCESGPCGPGTATP